MGYIYLITNLVNGKEYVGYTSNTIEQRFKEHWRQRNNGNCILLYAAMRKYEKEDFSIQQLEEMSEENWADREKYWIRVKNTLRPNGYNIAEGGNKPPRCLGDSNFKTKIPDEKILELYKELLTYEKPITQLAEEYGVSSSQVEKINKGLFRKIEGYNFPLRKEKWQIHRTGEIIEDMKKGLSQDELEEKYQIKSRTNLYDISHGKIGRKTHPQSSYPIREDIVNRDPKYLSNSKTCRDYPRN